MFTAIDYDVPPPPEDEVVYFRRPVLVFDDPDYGFPPPPSPPVFFLPPPPPDFVVLAPPPPVFAAFVLPVPDYVPMPAYYSPPPYVAPPPNVIYNNIHNTVVINTTTNMVTITKPGGEAQTVTPAQALASQPVSVNQTAASPTACRTGNVRRAECSEHHSHTVARDSRGVAAAGAAVAEAALLARWLPRRLHARLRHPRRIRRPRPPSRASNRMDNRAKGKSIFGSEAAVHAEEARGATADVSPFFRAGAVQNR